MAVILGEGFTLGEGVHIGSQTGRTWLETHMKYICSWGRSSDSWKGAGATVAPLTELSSGQSLGWGFGQKKITGTRVLGRVGNKMVTLYLFDSSFLP